MSRGLEGIRAWLFDLDGTVFQDGALIRGAARTIEELKRRRIPHAFVTNTSSRPRSRLVAELAEMGLAMDPERVFTPPVAARDFLLRSGVSRCALLVPPPVREDLAGIEADDSSPEAVLLGYLGGEFTFDRLNRAFRHLLDGAGLVVLGGNRYFRGSGGLTLDVGSFAALLETASGVHGTRIGKPSIEFFRWATGALGTEASETAVMGDDLEADVLGARAAGMRGVLVRTGKFRPADLEGSRGAPDLVLDSIAELAPLL